MNRSELIERVAAKHDRLPPRDVEQAVKMMIEHLSMALADGSRVDTDAQNSVKLHNSYNVSHNQPIAIGVGESVQFSVSTHNTMNNNLKFQ